MGRRSLSLAALLLVSLVLPQRDAAAQAQVKKQRRVPTPEEGQPFVPLEGESEKTLTIQFPGGTVGEYISILRAQDEDVNIVTNGEVETVGMGAVTLKRVGLQTALDLIQATAGEGNAVVVRSLKRAESGGSVYVLSPARGHARVPTADSILEPPQKRLQVFSLRKLTRAAPRFPLTALAGEGGTDPEARRAEAALAQKKAAEEHQEKVMMTVLTAVQTALDFQDPDTRDKAVIKFHTDSGLLLAQGSEEQINLIREVLNMLAEEGPEEAQDTALHVVMDDDVIAELREAIGKLNQEVAKLRAELEPLKKLSAEGTQKPLDVKTEPKR